MRAVVGGHVIRSVEFDLVTKSEANQRFASKAGMFAKSSRVQKQRAAVRDVLAAHHTAPRCFVNVSADPIADDARSVTMAQVQASLGATKPNRITVRLTRIAPGELDDDNLRGALKAVRDAIAAWIGTNDRDPLIAWEYGQERAGSHVYRVRVQLTDLAPGADRRVVLAETTSEGRAAASRIKRLTTKAAKGATNVQTKNGDTTPEAAFRAASHRRLRDGDEGTVRRNGTLQAVTSSGRAAAEAAFAKVTGKPPAPPAKLTAAAVAAYGPGVEADAEALAAMREQARSVACEVCGAGYVNGPPCGAVPVAVRCPTCGTCSGAMHDGRRMVCLRCPGNVRLETFTPPWEYGVHTARARAAGLPPYPTVEQLNAGVRPVKVSRTCGTCDGDEDAPQCKTCGGSGKVAAWEWQTPSKRRATITADVVGEPTDAQREKWRAEGRAAERGVLRRKGLIPPAKPDGDPGEERPARDLAPCTTCGAAVGELCTPIENVPVYFGVHATRARMAGLNIDNPTPRKAPTNGTRRLVPAATPPPAPKAPPTAYMALPWEQPPCEACDGNGTDVDAEGVGRCPTCKGRGYCVTRLAPLRLATLPDELARLVPPEHHARYGVRVTLTRTRLSTPQTGDTWLFQPTKER